MSRRTTLFALLSATALLAGCAGLPSNAPVVWEGPPPEQPIVWVYTREFAERFGMPPENVDDSLKGALAVFMRVYPETLVFPHKNVVSTMNACQIGLFLKPGAFPRDLWLRGGDFGYQIVNGNSSPGVLRNFDGLSINSKALREENLFMAIREDRSGGAYFLTEYYREIFPGVDYTLLGKMCGSGTTHRNWIHLGSKTASYQYIEIPDALHARWHQLYSGWILGDAKRKWLNVTRSTPNNN